MTQEIVFEESIGNVFTDLGLEDADDRDIETAIAL
jgi:hypothetical protein